LAINTENEYLEEAAINCLVDIIKSNDTKKSK